MENEKAVAIRDGSEVSVGRGEQFSSALMVTPQYIEQQKQTMALLQSMVKDVLVEDRDYGSVSGIPEDFLWDPGASQIIGAFNCRVGPARIINQTFTDDLVAVVLEVPLISFQTKEEVCCCIGAASTNEVKRKYRWVRKYELADWGIVDENVINTLKTKKDDWDNVKYRILNPEPGDLLNTIWKIAHKRGRVGAAQLLPGVSAALREKFAKPDKYKSRKKEPTSDWDIFWADMTKRGLKAEEVHGMLGVKSAKDWVKSGKTLIEATAFIDTKLSEQSKSKETPTTPESQDQQPKEAIKAPVKPPAVDTSKWKKPEEVRTFVDLYNACMAQWSSLFKTKESILHEAGYKNQQDVAESPSSIYATILHERLAEIKEVEQSRK